MSWLTGSDATTFGSDLSGILHNALTGQLTEEQKADVAVYATKGLNACQEDPSSDACQQLLKQNTAIVNKVAPNEKCAIRLPVYGCVESWGNLAAVVLVAIIAIAALYGIIFFNPRRFIS